MEVAMSPHEGEDGVSDFLRQGLRNFWYVVARSEDLETKPKANQMPGRGSCLVARLQRQTASVSRRVSAPRRAALSGANSRQHPSMLVPRRPARYRRQVPLDPHGRRELHALKTTFGEELSDRREGRADLILHLRRGKVSRI